MFQKLFDQIKHKHKRPAIISILFSCSLLMLMLLFAGCEKKEEIPPIDYNAALSDPAFKNDLSGYRIFLIAPASSLDPDKIKKLQEITDLKIDVPENSFDETVPYHASSDEQRFENLKKLLESTDPNVILWSLRGGYGSARLIEKLQTLPKPKQEKIIIGYSDITALHLFLSKNWGWKTIHAAMLSDFVNTKKDSQNLLRLSHLLKELKDPDQKTIRLEINHLKPLNTQANNLQTVEGPLTGGNLSIVETSIGTSWQMDAKNKIVFLEEVGDKGYKIDRTLMHLKQAGLMNGVKAIVFGDFSESDEFSDQALKRFSEETNIPIFKTDEFGHGLKNYPIVYNANAKIVKSTDNTSNLIMEFEKQ